jgi:hypothetical protein
MLYGMEKSLMAGWVDLYERSGKAFVSPLPLVRGVGEKPISSYSNEV